MWNKKKSSLSLTQISWTLSDSALMPIMLPLLDPHLLHLVALIGFADYILKKQDFCPNLSEKCLILDTPALT